MNWVIGIDMYTLMCIKWMTNNLLYKKINKIQKLKKTTKNPVESLICNRSSTNVVLIHSEIIII